MRVVLAEDGVLIREGIAGLLTRFGHDVVAAVGDAPGLMSAVSAYEPDLVVTDVRMPPGFSDEGLRAALALRADRPKLPLLVLSQYIELTYAGELLDSPGDTGIGYLLKDRITDVTEFIEAAARVAAGDTIIDPRVIRQMLRRRRHPLDRLTEREREVLAFMAEGRSNQAIASALNVTEAAVGKHITNIFTKLDLPPADADNRRVLAVLTYLRRADDPT
ncbi:response regulator transcription factor [Rugosimonospora acidiphila]|uniref:response regulator transcription factor n=1 Tax=Rugosimonospora acidiphila TaxID=556531 RepID=UPI0031E559DF